MTDALLREVRAIGSREQWLEWHRQDLTAGRVSALFAGADRYASLAEVVAEISGHGPVRKRTAAMRAGILLEACFPAAVAEARPDWVLRKATTYHRLPEHRLGCTPDFWVDDAGLLQAKTCSERVWQTWHGRPPLGYTLQTLVELLVTGRGWGVLGVIVRSADLPLYLFEVPRHAAAESKILAAVADFWRRWESGEMPVPVGSEELAELLDDGSHIDLSSDDRLPEWLARRELLVADRDGAARQVKQIDQAIKSCLGAASSAWLPGWEISWRAQHRGEFTVPAADIRVLRVKRVPREGQD